MYRLATAPVENGTKKLAEETMKYVVQTQNNHTVTKRHRGICAGE